MSRMGLIEDLTHWRFDYMPEGTYEIGLSSGLSGGSVPSVTIAPNQTTTVSFEFPTPEGYVIHVVDESGRWLPGCGLAATNEEPAPEASLEKADGTRVTLHLKPDWPITMMEFGTAEDPRPGMLLGAPPGKATLTVTHFGHGQKVLSIERNPHELKSIDVTLVAK